MRRDLQRARDDLSRIAHLDLLTGLPNRRGFDTDARQAFEAARSNGRPVAALMCDVDHFKLINDGFGHDFGDAALVRIAEIIRATFAGTAHIACRQGGEEFALILPDCLLPAASRLAETLRGNCADAPIAALGLQAPITVSIGVAVADGDLCDLRKLMQAADAALYEAKRGGRNRVVVVGDDRPEQDALPLPAAG